MATIHPSAENSEAAEDPYVPHLTAEELARRNQAIVELLNVWVNEGDEQEQRETLAAVRETLGAGRVVSSRNLFP